MLRAWSIGHHLFRWIQEETTDPISRLGRDDPEVEIRLRPENFGVARAGDSLISTAEPHSPLLSQLSLDNAQRYSKVPSSS